MRRNVHSRGSIITPAELVEEATGRPPSPNDFVEYLKQKVEKLYDLEA
jgi:Zn-dependent M32 family carboxypeptidase